MTTDGVIQCLQNAMTKPLSPRLHSIGFPREKTTDGKLLRRLASVVAATEPSFPAAGGPFYRMTFEQLRTLEAELGRAICNSGDCLFGLILVTMFCSDDDPLDAGFCDDMLVA